MNSFDNFKERNLDYLNLLAKSFPDVASASTEIINLCAILNLPKGTEHFISDVHGEFESFSHVLRNASGVIKQKIEDIYGTSLMESEKKMLATLIYYPEEKLDEIIRTKNPDKDWYKVILFRLIQVCKVVSTKYTRSKVRKALPVDFAYILEELIHEDQNRLNKFEYYNGIVETIIRLHRSKAFIIAISNLIQRLAVDRLHIIGDIYDRGPRADMVMDTLMNYHSIDIQWGNHDIIWMGAHAGSATCMCNVIRICARYDNLDMLEDSYGINLLPLVRLAMNDYSGINLDKFMPKGESLVFKTDDEINLIAQIHKAISIIQFKLEGQLIKRRPDFNMESRLLLDKIDYNKGTIMIKGKEYKLNDTDFPTINPENPYELTKEEENVVNKLLSSFRNSPRLEKHINFMFLKGSLQKVFNSNLLFHGCIPLKEDGSFECLEIDGKSYYGKDFMEKVEQLIRSAYMNSNEEEKSRGLDIIWYMWCGEKSPIFGKKEMTTFERYFIDDVSTHHEEKNPYYKFIETNDTIEMIFKDYGLDPSTSHIINGHVPVKVKKGENPIKGNGKVFVIDGGFSRAYQSETGIAGYTLIYNSQGMHLVSHQPFESTQKAITDEIDIHSTRTIVERSKDRLTVKDTDIGKEILEQINDLTQLLEGYRSGVIKELK